ncbi:MAG TPA: hydroxylamine reductase, partial [Polyangia bacterium]
MSMFCYQCEQTMGGKGCSVVGVCGKDATTAGLMDLLCAVTQGVSQYAHRAALLGARDASVDRFVIESLFTTVTNVNFDSERIAGWVRNAVAVRATARALYEKACAKAGKPAEGLIGPATLAPADSIAAMQKQAEEWGIPARTARKGATIAGLEELVLYGLKGAAAYADHAWVLGKVDDGVSAFFHKTLDFLTVPHTVEEYLGMALAVGESNLKVMALLDGANTGAYAHPTPTAVRITAKKGKAILVSGHDLKDLHTLLELTRDKGINIYTHGEMLPAHGYPELKKYPHLVGNYGGAWQDQAKEFDAFPGAILMTTNCIQNPRQSYKARIFTTGLVGWPGVTHVANGDFGPVVQAALAAPGFAEDQLEKTILTGFGHQAVLGVADKVVAAVKSGAIKHF